MKNDDDYRDGYSVDATGSASGEVAAIDDDDIILANDEIAQEGTARERVTESMAIDEVAVAEADTVAGYGDLIAEEFSAEEAIKKVKKLTHLSEKTVEYALSIIYFIVGVLCVALTKYIHLAFRFIVGGFMAVIGIGQFIYAIKTKEYVHTHSNKTATSLIMIGLSALIMIEAESADVIIAVAWGLLGLFEAAHAFNHAISRIARSERCVYYLAKGLIELALAFILLHDPLGDHLTMHIFVLGLNLIFDAITMFPPIKARLTKK